MAQIAGYLSYKVNIMAGEDVTTQGTNVSTDID